MAFVEIRSASKTYISRGAKTEVLADINLEIDEGEFVAIVGSLEEGWLLVFEHDPTVPWGRLDPDADRPALLE